MIEQREEKITEAELINQFNTSNDIESKLHIFSQINDDTVKVSLLNAISENERYKFILKINSSDGIASALNAIQDEIVKQKTFQFVVKQMKGNNGKLIEILGKINFQVELSDQMLLLKLNNLNTLNLDVLINLKRNVKNYKKMKFSLNEKSAENVEYRFGEMVNIINKIQEVTLDIGKNDSDYEKFRKIYMRLISTIIYDHECVRKTNEIGCFETKKKAKVRRRAAGLYGGLVEGKAICAGYAIILHEIAQYIGLKSKYVVGADYKRGYGHAWNQIQIDGKWYNVDATWDSEQYQKSGKIPYMLLCDQDFSISHSYEIVSPHRHKCASRYDVH